MDGSVLVLEACCCCRLDPGWSIQLPQAVRAAAAASTSVCRLTGEPHLSVWQQRREKPSGWRGNEGEEDEDGRRELSLSGHWMDSDSRSIFTDFFSSLFSLSLSSSAGPASHFPWRHFSPSRTNNDCVCCHLVAQNTPSQLHNTRSAASWWIAALELNWGCRLDLLGHTFQQKCV